jgi:hypothetical protein
MLICSLLVVLHFPNALQQAHYYTASKHNVVSDLAKLATCDLVKSVQCIADNVSCCTSLMLSVLTALEWGFSAIYYLNSTRHYVMAASALHSDEDSILVDYELPEVEWLNELRYDKRWLVDGTTAVTKRMHMLGRKYIMSARYYRWLHFVCLSESLQLHICTQYAVRTVEHCCCESVYSTFTSSALCIVVYYTSDACQRMS